MSRNIRQEAIITTGELTWRVELEQERGAPSEQWTVRTSYRKQSGGFGFHPLEQWPTLMRTYGEARSVFEHVAASLRAAGAVLSDGAPDDLADLGRKIGPGIAAGLRENPPFPGPAPWLSMMIGENRWRVRAREITHEESKREGDGFYVFVTVEPVPPGGSSGPRDEVILTRRICNSPYHRDTVVATACAVARLIGTLHDGDPWKPLRFSLLELIP